MNYSKYFPIPEYYRKFVRPINPKYRVTKGDKMVCPLHDDHDPSLGVINTKDGEIFHCFGCNAWGDVVELHIRVCRRLFKKYLSEEEALKDLCRIFEVDYNKLPKEDPSDENKDIRQEIELSKALSRYDIDDFRAMITEGKRQKKGVGYFNTVMMVMVDELKKRE